MISEYYDSESLINVLKSHVLPEEVDKIDWNRVIEDGELFPHLINGVDRCYIYSVPAQSMEITVFVHPTVCTEVYYDAWTSKDVYMGRAEGEIW